MPKLGPFFPSPAVADLTGIDHIEQFCSRALSGRALFDGPTYVYYSDGRKQALVSAGIRLSPSTVDMFAKRAYYASPTEPTSYPSGGAI